MKALIKIFAMLLIAAMASFFIACSEDEDPIQQKVPRTVTGSWAGTISAIGGTITLNLSQTGNTVTGSGFIAAGAFNQACTVTSGTCTDPNISLIISVQGFQDISYTGAFQGDSKDIHKGNLNGSGFLGEAITFVRQ